MTVVLTDNTAGTVKNKTGVEKSAPSSSKTAVKKKTTTKKKEVEKDG